MRRIILLAVLAALVAAAPARAQDPNQMVAAWYQRYLGRGTDPYAAAWVNALRGGSSPSSVLAQILGSPEYYQRAGNTPQGFVQRLFLDVLGRGPSPGEWNFWVNQLNFRDATSVAYDFLTRYPQDFGAAFGPSSPPPPAPAFEYRRPYRYWHRPWRDWDRHRRR
jgi:hypothetical protein